MISVVLAGGKGVRLWPESTETRPKQLCDFFDGKSMLEHTIDRLIAAGTSEVIIITNQDQVETIGSLRGLELYLDKITIVGEPRGCNTAPAVGLALARYLKERPEEVLAVFPSDHYIKDTRTFAETIQKALEVARSGFLVTIGITPTYPETGYGYIQLTDEEVAGVRGAFKVESFKEKPDIDTATKYVEGNRHLWNAGIFIAKVSTLAQDYARYLPGIFEFIEKGYETYIANYEKLPSISLDYGIAEKSNRVAVVAGDFGWSDVGSWKAVAELLAADSHNNVLLGNDIVTIDVNNCLVKQSQKTIALLGTKDLVVVETEAAIMICHKDESQNVRKIVELLAAQGRHQLL